MRVLKIGILCLLGLLVIAVLLYQVPGINQRLSWRLDFAMTYLRGVLDPVEAIPTALPDPVVVIEPTPTPTGVQPATPTRVVNEVLATRTPLPPTPTAPSERPSPTPIPPAVTLMSPGYEKQDINNCGPATLAMNLRYYGWGGDQFEIASLLKPTRQDRNVNVEELVYFVRNRAGWLAAEYRVGGDILLLKELLAAGFPVIIEESFYFEAPFWPNDDLWAAHYNLLTGYDDSTQTFTSQDSYHGPDQVISYQTLDRYWQSFNRVYIILYPPDRETALIDILGEDWDPEINRQGALNTAMAETEAQPDNAFAWFNLGSNLVYFERYTEAAQAFDTARSLGLPQRMLRYQFSPFIAYFHSGRTEDLMALAEYAIQRTPNAEEALLWRGWGHYRSGNTNQAVADFRQALGENPNYLDAQYALDYVWDNP